MPDGSIKERDILSCCCCCCFDIYESYDTNGGSSGRVFADKKRIAASLVASPPRLIEYSLPTSESNDENDFDMEISERARLSTWSGNVRHIESGAELIDSVSWSSLNVRECDGWAGGAVAVVVDILAAIASSAYCRLLWTEDESFWRRSTSSAASTTAPLCRALSDSLIAVSLDRVGNIWETIPATWAALDLSSLLRSGVSTVSSKNLKGASSASIVRFTMTKPAANVRLRASCCLYLETWVEVESLTHRLVKFLVGSNTIIPHCISCESFSSSSVGGTSTAPPLLCTDPRLNSPGSNLLKPDCRRIFILFLS